MEDTICFSKEIGKYFEYIIILNKLFSFNIIFKNIFSISRTGKILQFYKHFLTNWQRSFARIERVCDCWEIEAVSSTKTIDPLSAFFIQKKKATENRAVVIFLQIIVNCSFNSDIFRLLSLRQTLRNVWNNWLGTPCWGRGKETAEPGNF